MTHLPYIVAVYTLGVLVPVGYAIDAWLRSRRATRRLALIDTRRLAASDLRKRK